MDDILNMSYSEKNVVIEIPIRQEIRGKSLLNNILNFCDNDDNEYLYYLCYR